MPVYREEARIADTDKEVVAGGPGIPREASGGGVRWRRRRVWRGVWGWGQEGSRSRRDNVEINKS